MTSRTGGAASASRKLTAGVLAATLLVSGCQTTGMRMLGGGGAAADDPCGTERVAFRDSETFFTEEIVKGAAVGALGGAALGFLIGRATGGNAGQAALFGALAGGTAGAVSNYYKARAQNATDATALAGQIHQDIALESNKIDRAMVTYVKLKTCRLQAAEQIKANHAAGVLTYADAKSQLDAQKAWFTQELELAKALNVRMKKRQGEFLEASTLLVDEHGGGTSGYDTWRQTRPDTTVWTVKNANVRAEPSTSGRKLATLDTGTALAAFSDTVDDKWVKVVLDDGRDAYVWGSLVGAEKPAEAPETRVAAKPTPAAEPETVEQTTYVAYATAAEVLPEKRQGYESELADSEEQVVAFSLTPLQGDAPQAD